MHCSRDSGARHGGKRRAGSKGRQVKSSHVTQQTAKQLHRPRPPPRRAHARFLLMALDEGAQVPIFTKFCNHVQLGGVFVNDSVEVPDDVRVPQLADDVHLVQGRREGDGGGGGAQPSTKASHGGVPTTTQ